MIKSAQDMKIIGDCKKVNKSPKTPKSYSLFGSWYIVVVTY